MSFFKRSKAPMLSPQGEAYLLNEVTSTLKRGDLAGLFGHTHEGRRDLNAVYGYKVGGARSYSYFYDMYKLGGYAQVAVAKVVRSCWRDGATIEVDDKPVLEDEMKALTSAGLFIGEENADILNRIGKFSVLFVGIPDGRVAKEPVGPVRGKNRFDEVYFSPFSMDSVVIESYEQDPMSPRYGLPVIYNLTPNTGNADNSGTSASDIRQPMQAHWTRLVHMAEGSLTNELYGTFYLDPIANRLEDLNKTIGGSAEAFYANAKQKKTLDIDKEAKIGKDEMIAFGASATEWINDMKDFIGLKGAKITALDVPNADPTETVAVALQEVTAYTGIPKRLFIGEGAGQLAGNEDKGSYNQTVNDRQHQLCANWLTKTLEVFERASMLVLPESFTVKWPVPDAMDELTASETKDNNAGAFQKVMKGLADANVGGVDDTVVQLVADAFGVGKVVNGTSSD